MQRGTSVLFGLLLAGAIVVVVLQSRRAGSSEALATSDAGADAADAEGAEASAEVPPGGDAGDGGPGALLPDGGAVPELSDKAPKRVSFGVILFKYRGAERSRKNTRSKSKALELAKALIDEAKENFEEAAKKGDRGSRADMGKVPRGVLEARLEYVLFSLKKGEVHPEPVDAPTGYWVVRRNE